MGKKSSKKQKAARAQHAEDRRNGHRGSGFGPPQRVAIADEELVEQIDDEDAEQMLDEDGGHVVGEQTDNEGAVEQNMEENTEEKVTAVEEAREEEVAVVRINDLVTFLKYVGREEDANIEMEAAKRRSAKLDAEDDDDADEVELARSQYLVYCEYVWPVLDKLVMKSVPFGKAAVGRYFVRLFDQYPYVFFGRVGDECVSDSPDGDLIEGYECNYTDGDYNFVSKRALEGTLLYKNIANAMLPVETQALINMRLHEGSKLPAVYEHIGFGY